MTDFESCWASLGVIESRPPPRDPKHTLDLTEAVGAYRRGIFLDYLDRLEAPIV